MNRIQKLEKMVREIYDRKESTRDEWADWLSSNHVFLVAKFAEELSLRYGVKNDLAIAAGMLHDIADSVMARENPDHEKKSKEIARDFLLMCGYSDEESKIVIDDAIEFHGCKNGNLPKTIEGKIMTSADAMVHLQSDFYDFALEMKMKDEPVEQVRSWALAKIERDFNDKIFFDEIRNEMKGDYVRVKELAERIK